MIVVDAGDLSRAAYELATVPEKVPKVIRISINKGVDHAFTAIKRHITQIYNIKPAQAARTLKKEKAKDANLVGGVVSSAPHNSWNKFGLKPTKPPKQLGVKVKDRKRVSVEIRRGKRIEFDKKVFLVKVENAPDEPGLSTHIGAFIKKDKGRYIKRTRSKHPTKEGKMLKKTSEMPIKEIMTIGSSEMIKSKKILAEVRKETFAVVDGELTRQIDRALGRKA
jgi:hypothetical protein